MFEAELPRISKPMFAMKRVFPTLMFGGLSVAVVGLLIERTPLFLHPLAMMVFAYFITKYFVWSLVDEVRDGGSFLLVKNGDLEQRIELRDIINVSFQSFVNPPRVTLLLRTPGPFGKEVVFSPNLGFRLNVFARAPLVDALIARIDAARLGH